VIEMKQMALVCDCGFAYTPDGWLQIIRQKGSCKCGALEDKMHYDFQYSGSVLSQSDVWLAPTDLELQRAKNLMIRIC
jgi:hypothetical protein